MEATNKGGAGFEFGFNDPKFSDRILIIQILPDPPKPISTNRICGEVRCVYESILLNSSWLFTLCSPSDRVLQGDETDQNQDEEPSSSPAGPTILRVKTVHISSIVLAHRSPFFYKMFSNGMKESEQAKVTLQIYASEETALMDLIQFTYSSKLFASAPTALLDVLILADKYQVPTCITMCGKLLQEVPLNCELALSYVDLPSSVVAVDGVSQLVAAAKGFLAKISENITEHEEEAMKLPLDRVKVALSSDKLKVPSEDEVYEFVLKWVTAHFPNLNDRQEVLSSQLCRCIRFPHLSCQKLREVLTCCDLDPKVASMLVLEALFFKVERLDAQRSLMKAKLHTSHGFSYLERAYKLHPVRVIEFDAPLLQCIAHLDLRKEDVTLMDRICSQDFYAGGNQFCLKVARYGNASNEWFGMHLFRKSKSKPDVDPVTVQYEFAVRQKANGKFTKHKGGKYKFTGDDSCGFFNLFDTQWDALISNGSQYFIDDVMYIRADVIVEKVQAPPSPGANPVPRQ